MFHTLQAKLPLPHLASSSKHHKVSQWIQQSRRRKLCSNPAPGRPGQVRQVRQERQARQAQRPTAKTSVYSVWVCMQWSNLSWRQCQCNEKPRGIFCLAPLRSFAHSAVIFTSENLPSSNVCKPSRPFSARSIILKQARRSEISCLSVLCCMACLEVNRPSRNLVPLKGQWQWSIPPSQPTITIISLRRHLKSCLKNYSHLLGVKFMVPIHLPLNILNAQYVGTVCMVITVNQAASVVVSTSSLWSRRDLWP